MAREHLYKAKRKDNGEWVQGYLFKIWNKAYILWGTTNDIPNMIEVLPTTICEYTNKTDKNGTKVFEWDIVRTLAPCCLDKPRYVKGVVMFGEYSTPYTKGHWGYYVDWDLTKNLAIYCATKDIEVIGNKFDNPELLEVQDEQ